MLNTVEKSAEGIVGERQATLVRHCNVERRSPRYARAVKPNTEGPNGSPARGLKERRSRLPRNSGIAFGEPMGRKPGGWNEPDVGAVGEDAPVGMRRRYALHIDLICRTAGYVTRTSGGVGGGSREASPYPK